MLPHLMGEYDLRLRKHVHLPKVVPGAGGRGHVQSQSGWPQNTSFNSVNVGTSALVPSGSAFKGLALAQGP